jgi:thiopeptide-type bacteriocin biosynthesis protein
MIDTKYFINNEWLYLKIYTNEIHSDNILLQLSELNKKLLKKKYFTTFFFIRYNDPHFHLRIRYKKTNNISSDEIINYIFKVLDTFIKNEYIWNIVSDTYIREVDRYGLSNISLTEKVFHIDSKNTLSILENIILNNLEYDIKMNISIIYIINYVDVFIKNNDKKIELFEFMNNTFANEFNSSKLTKNVINNWYSKNRNIIISKNIVNFNLNIFLMSNFIDDSIKSSIFENLKNDSIKLYDYIFSLVHMFMNRFYNQDNRKMEFIIYNILLKYYKSMNYISNA